MGISGLSAFLAARKWKTKTSEQVIFGLYQRCENVFSLSASSVWSTLVSHEVTLVSLFSVQLVGFISADEFKNLD